MKLEIKSDQVELGKAIEAHIQRKLKLALSKAENFIDTISISLSDVLKESDIEYEPEISAKCCRLRVTIANLPDIEVEDTQADLYCAIDRVIQKLTRILNRKLLSAQISEAK